MDNKKLQHLTEDLSKDYFGRPFRHRIFFNGRLRTTGGRYALHSHDIEINPKHYEYYGMEEVVSIIKHELCHYHLHLEGKGYHHRDPEFKQLLKEVGGSRHCRNLPQRGGKQTVFHVYECTSCAHEYERKRRMNTEKYVCGKCRGKLKKVRTKNNEKALT
ncbi:SprT family protein [Alkalicoccus saliphilus]|uniref:Protein SprT-like n=1 Tax=Alkalicoccus saliphilus TaxID=200989 RepID=A0A2T4U5H0_9BACI|nr:SprT family protein [Alkalicoccus saliphilus]PTL38634.1 SprT family protein [Alkalicoccus saliphilus]